MRNKQENVFLVGLLPGPSEPSNINGFLQPFINELEELWESKGFITSGAMEKVVLSASCDLPAGKKLCGLLSFSAHQGC